MKTKKIRSDKKFYALKNNDCCVLKETYIFQSRTELKNFWRKNDGSFNGDFYDVGKQSLKSLLENCRSDFELKNLMAQI